MTKTAGFESETSLQEKLEKRKGGEPLKQFTPLIALSHSSSAVTTGWKTGQFLTKPKVKGIKNRATDH